MSTTIKTSCRLMGNPYIRNPSYYDVELLDVNCTHGNNCNCKIEKANFDNLIEYLRSNWLHGYNRIFKPADSCTYTFRALENNEKNYIPNKTPEFFGLMEPNFGLDIDVSTCIKIQKKFYNFSADILASKYKCRPMHTTVPITISYNDSIYVFCNDNYQANSNGCISCWRFDSNLQYFVEVEIIGDEIRAAILSAHHMVESNMLLFGGSVDMECTIFTNDMYRLTFQDQNKIQVQQLKYCDTILPPMLGSSLTYAGENTFYIAGGKTNDGYNNDIWKVKLSESNMVECEIISSINNDRHSGTTDNSYMIDSSVYTKEIHNYKAENSNTSVCAFQHFCAEEQKLMLIGTHDSEEIASFENVLIIHVSKNSRISTERTHPDKKHGFPGKRKFSAAITYEQEDKENGKTPFLIIIAGVAEKKLPTNMVVRQTFDDIWKLNLKNLQWTKCKSRLQIPVFFHGATVTKDGWVYIFGGIIDVHYRFPCNHLQRFKLLEDKK